MRIHECRLAEAFPVRGDDVYHGTPPPELEKFFPPLKLRTLFTLFTMRHLIFSEDWPRSIYFCSPLVRFGDGSLLRSYQDI